MFFRYEPKLAHKPQPGNVTHVSHVKERGIDFLPVLVIEFLNLDLPAGRETVAALVLAPQPPSNPELDQSAAVSVEMRWK
jgi:hypothetical protein